MLVGLFKRKRKKIFIPGERLKEGKLENLIDKKRLPQHIAIIMDGNGRWATSRVLPRAMGHRAGMESLKEIVKACVELKIKVLTVYAFSTENWKRPKEEIKVLMDLLVEYLYKEIDELCENQVCIKVIGCLSGLPQSAQEAVLMAQERSSLNKGLIFNVALNYGSRSELVKASKAVAEEVSSGRLELEAINEELISAHLYTAGQPDPDLLIRPAGDFRISNFLLWQLAYTEFWFTEVKWPDFRREHLLQAIVDFQKRERRFGGLKG